MSAAYDRLASLLRELFQLDQADLDFGIYRILHARKKEIDDFLVRGLPPRVKAAFAQFQSVGYNDHQGELAKAIAAANSLGVDPETTAKVKELRAKLAAQPDLGRLEYEAYDHLWRFFSRYYSDGDFLSKRVYRDGTYAIPYDGSEVVLHWANKDQYYIKTSEYLRDYAFRLRPDDAANPMRVHFRLVDAQEGAHNNVKTGEDQARVFILAPGGTSGTDFLAIEGDDLVIRFEYRIATLTDGPAGAKKPPKQKDLVAKAVEQLLSVTGEATLAPWIEGLTALAPTEGDSRRSVLAKHLDHYVKRNTFDYFIHKDLGGFLRRELDHYLKTEVMRLDDIDHADELRVEQYLATVKVIRHIAHAIIDFLAQVEDFQKKLWLKKKFVIRSEYCVPVSKIPGHLINDVINNSRQVQEWIGSYEINKIEPTTTGDPGFSMPLKADFFDFHPNLPVDTIYFDESFKEKLLESFSNLHEDIRGLLVNSDNLAALRLTSRRFAESVKMVYIDPPYNTGDDGFMYKDSYKHSSWLSMMESRLRESKALLKQNYSMNSSIDDNESSNLRKLLDSVFPSDHFVAEIAFERSGSSGLGQGGKIVNTKEIIYSYSGDKSSLNDVMYERPIDFEVMKRYSKILASPGTRLKIDSFVAPSTGEDVVIYKHTDYVINSISLRNYEERVQEIAAEYAGNFPNIFRLTSVQKENEFQNRIISLCQNGLFSADYLVSRGRFAGQRVTLYYIDGQIVVWLRDSARLDGVKVVKGNKITDHWSHAEIPKADLANEGGVTLSRGKKPEQLMRRLLEWATNENDYVLDYFAGSGTTAAVAHKLGRRYISIDNELYFRDKSLQRIKNVIAGEQSGISKIASWSGGGVCQYLLIESYEDTLNNLKLRRDEAVQERLDNLAAPPAFRDEYLLRYHLNLESRGSASLLTASAFLDPLAYQLSVTVPGSDERRPVTVDLIETFTWLLGLRVESQRSRQSVKANLERQVDADLPADAPRRLVVTGALRPDPTGEWWFKPIEGTDPEGRRVLVIWRNRPGGDSVEGLERDNAVLNAWVSAQGYAARDFHRIYVNGDNQIENLRQADQTWTVRLIDTDFAALMFADTAEGGV